MKKGEWGEERKKKNKEKYEDEKIWHGRKTKETFIYLHDHAKIRDSLRHVSLRRREAKPREVELLEELKLILRPLD